MSLLRQRETQDQISATPAAFAAAGPDGHELLAVHHVGGGRRKNAGPGVVLPQHLTGLGVERVKEPGDVAAGTDKCQPAGGDDGSRLTPAVEDFLPDALASRRIPRGKISLRRPARSVRTVDRVDVKETGARTV